jgi:hypothetical protein
LQAINIPSKIAKYMTEGVGKQRINGETIAGIALVFMGLLFIWAGTMNPVWASIRIAAYVLVAIGAGFIAIGVVSIRRTNHPSEKHGYY